MARLLSVLLPVLLVPPLALPTVAPNQEPDATEFTELEKLWNEAHLGGDAEALDRLWADDLVVTVPGMAPMSKDGVLGFARSGRMVFTRYETSDLRVRVYGEAAVVTGRLLRSRTLNGQAVDDDWRFTKVYVRRDQRWQVVAFQASTAP